jgi:heterodisulfide reductase subunit D
MAKNRVKDAIETGAQVVVSACPLCKRNLSDAVREMDSSLKVLDVVELAYYSLGK